jgi:hypothetical protein
MRKFMADIVSVGLEEKKTRRTCKSCCCAGCNSCCSYQNHCAIGSFGVLVFEEEAEGYGYFIV